MELSMPSAYEILNLTPGATKQEIRSRYLQAVKLVHTDKGGNADDFNKVNNAYQELKTIHDANCSLQDDMSMSKLAPVENYLALLTKQPSMSDPAEHYLSIYHDFVHKNKIFYQYAKQTLVCIDQQIIEPIIILKQLLSLYIDPSHSIWTLFGKTRSHLTIAKKMKAALVNALEQANKVCATEREKVQTQLLSHVERYEFHNALQYRKHQIHHSGFLRALAFTNEITGDINPNGEFTELFNALLSAFPEYLACVPNCKFKDSLQLTDLSSIYVEKMIKPAYQTLIAKHDHLYSHDDLKLVTNTHGLNALLTKTLQKLSAEPNALLANLKNLNKIAKRATALELETLLLPAMLTLLKNDLNFTDLEEIFSILKRCIKSTINPAVIQSIIPVLINSSMGRHIFIIDSLTEIALLLGNKSTEISIFPTLIACSQNPNLHVKLKAYAALTTLLPTVYSTLIESKLAQQMMDDHKKFPELATVLYELFAKITQSAHKTAHSLSNNSLKILQIANQLSPYINQHYAQTFSRCKAGVSNKEIIQNCKYLKSQLIVLSAETLTVDILPLIMSRLTSKDIDLQHAALDLLAPIASLPLEQVAIEQKQEILMLLIKLLSKEISVPVLNVLQHYLVFCQSPSVLGKLYWQIYPCCDFRDKSCFHPINNASLDLLIELCKHPHDINLDGKLIYLFNLLESSQLNQRGLEFFRAALEATHPDFAKELIFPATINALTHTNPDITELALDLIPLLSYEENMYFMHQILKSFDQNDLDKPAKTAVLCELYASNKAFLAQQQLSNVFNEEVSHSSVLRL
jgi:hypothetical protein